MGLRCWNDAGEPSTQNEQQQQHQQKHQPQQHHSTSSPGTGTMSEVVRPGASSPLIDVLPLEIRLQIYEYLLFENGNFFSLDDEEGNSVPTLFPKLRAPPRRKPIVACTQDPQVPSPDRRSSRGNIMSLLLTSKKIYNESASLLYSSAFFRLRGIHTTVQFINTVAPEHLALVRSLKLVWDDQGWASAPEYDTPTLRLAWPTLCDALATSLPGLRNLYVALGVPSCEDHIEALYLGEEGLSRVRHVDNFKVCLPVGFLARHYGADDGGHRAAGHEGEKPYQLCRHTAGEVCSVRREVITAEWLGDSRPSTPKLREDVMPNAPDLEPWADAEWVDDDNKGLRAAL